MKYLTKENEEDLKRTAPRVTIPDPEMTKDKKFKCPIDQEVYDNRKDYDGTVKKNMTSYKESYNLTVIIPVWN